ncbi:hypothetical protein ANCCAN_11684 [Ancylostoma caninum]|uniref:RRM domain-containing protein n=1 Tax=Ancylostoma caninum TaxID=29170 RepID=A0A368GGF4_ANCCA|nr:hypothetical protein ANCCAN_11684 [Ancylostoma caninum]
MNKECVTEDKLKEIFTTFGEIERIKKIKDYAFVHFKEREPCLKTPEEWNGKDLEGVSIDCSLGKPQMEKKKPMGRGRGMGMGMGYGGGPDEFGGERGRTNNMYPNIGFDDYSYGGGYGMGERRLRSSWRFWWTFRRWRLWRSRWRRIPWWTWWKQRRLCWAAQATDIQVWRPDFEEGQRCAGLLG